MARYRVKGNLVQSLSISRLQEASGRPCTLEVPHLVDDDVVDIHLELCQLLDKTLCLIKAQELRYADANKCRQVRVFELLVHLLHNVLQTRQLEALRERAGWTLAVRLPVLSAMLGINGMKGKYVPRMLIKSTPAYSMPCKSSKPRKTCRSLCLFDLLPSNGVTAIPVFHIELRCTFSSSSFPSKPSLPVPAPIMLAIDSIIPPNMPLSPISLESPFSRVDGNCSSRSVCPVGAVSNTMTL